MSEFTKARNDVSLYISKDPVNFEDLNIGDFFITVPLNPHSSRKVRIKVSKTKYQVLGSSDRHTARFSETKLHSVFFLGANLTGKEIKDALEAP